jgi:N6-L-threonylcarbamoyladenine synthase
LSASFQHAVVDDLVTRTLAAAQHASVRTVFVSGGVAANSALRAAFETEGTKRGFESYFPSRALSTDNAAMIAAAGLRALDRDGASSLAFNAEASLPISR